MSEIWIVSSILQWITIAVLCVVVLSLVRQLGIVFVRLNPSAGLDIGEGPGPGTEIPAQPMDLFPKGEYTLGGERSNTLLIASLSPDCSLCTAVAGHLRALARGYGDDLDILVVVNGTPRLVREFVETHELEDLPVGLRQNFPPSVSLPATTPFGVVVNPEGTVAARGTPNALEHLEEMVRAGERVTTLDGGRDPDAYAWGDALPRSESDDESNLLVHHSQPERNQP